MQYFFLLAKVVLGILLGPPIPFFGIVYLPVIVLENVKEIHFENLTCFSIPMVFKFYEQKIY